MSVKKAVKAVRRLGGGKGVVTCPETKASAAVHVDVTHAAIRG